MSRFIPFFSLATILFFTSCSSNEVGTIKDVDPESIWFDYRVYGDEGNGDIIVKLHYRFSGPGGASLLLEDPCKVEFDGEPLQADSSKMSGIYYELIRPVEGFVGRHSIVFTDINGKRYKEEFSFQPVILKTEIPEIVERDDLVFELDGIDSGDHITLMLNDTAAFSEGINRVDTVKDGRIIVRKEELEELANGPIRLDIIKEGEKRVKERTKQGGKLAVSYALMREFELKDAPVP